MSHPPFTALARHGALLCSALAVACLSPCRAGETALRETLEFAVARWRLQPAQGPTHPPDPGRWGRYARAAQPHPGWHRDWRFHWFQVEGAAWCKAGRGTVHDLWFENALAVPATWRGRRVLVDFERISGDAVVLLNGKRIGELFHPGGQLDVTQAVLFGERNTLRVFLTRNYTGISRGFESDLMNYTARCPKGRNIPVEQWPFGIMGRVTLSSRPWRAAVTDAFVRTSWRKKAIALDVAAFGRLRPP